MAAKLSRRERERQRHRREVLEAALNLFSQKGFEQTAMAAIAEQAEFAVQLIESSEVGPHAVGGAAMDSIGLDHLKVLVGITQRCCYYAQGVRRAKTALTAPRTAIPPRNHTSN